MRRLIPPHRRSPADAIAPEPQKRRMRLASLVPLWPHEIDDMTQGGRLKLVARLEGALRAERRRGLAGHWTYDLARHMQLLEAYRDEVKALRQKTMAPDDDVPGPI